MNAALYRDLWPVIGLTTAVALLPIVLFTVAAVPGVRARGRGAVWLPFLTGSLLLGVALLVLAESDRLDAPLGLMGRVITAMLTAGFLPAGPAATVTLLNSERISAGVQGGAAVLVGVVATAFAAPLLIFGVGCMLTGSCL